MDAGHGPGPGDAATTPHDEYRRRLDAASARVAHLARYDDAGATLRLVLFIALVVLAVMAFRGSLGVAWPLVVLGAFALLVVVHGRATAARRKAEAIAAYYQVAIDRLDGRWSGRGNPGTRFLDEDHPYAADLDLFGTGSIFERLCLAQTAAGERTLAAWLLSPADPAEVKERQADVAGMRGRLDLREDLAFLGRDVRAGGDPEALAKWGAEGPAAASPAWRWVAFGVMAATVATLVAWLSGWPWPRPFLALLAAECVVALLARRRADEALSGVADRGPELTHLADLLARIEREPFGTAGLSARVARFDAGRGKASARLARLARLVTWLEARHNTVFALIAAVLLWKTQIGLAVAAWRAAHGKEIGGWLEAVGEIEALSSIAGYSYENPDAPFPEFAEAGPMLEAEGLGHPLIAAARCVRNDIRLGAEPRVLAVSGSNMSGKSTWLRTVGANVVLAQAGAPVRATRMTLSPLAVGGTLKVHDSLQEGRSRFYAEILRLRQLLDLARGPRPLLFLIDEVLAGTNSHDRLQGAEAVIRGLLDRGAIGLFTTHDLTLAEVAGSLAPLAINVHFADHLDADGRLAFDYRMRPGVVEHSNALALMRAVGLEV
ncbi:MutS-related protein [Tundrisphaera sp. TA3]|uniref:MutS-related protein n=1 Tax=Tundrisphaera sp. TA3 TaxID=3435775 RepID=UPI003EC073D3